MKWSIVIWPVLTLISFIIAIIVNLASFFAKNGDTLFGSKFTLKDTNSEYNIQVSLPISYSIFAWLTIYLWNLSWQCYIIYIVACKFNYMTSTLFGNYFYQNFMISTAFNIAYIVLLINDYFFTAGLMLLFLTIFLYISNYLAHKFLMFSVPLALYSDPNTRSYSTVTIVNKVPTWIKQHHNLRKLFYWLLLNAIPFYCTYVSIELCIMLGSFFKYHKNSPLKNISDATASYISITVLSVGLLTYWLFDFCKFSKDYFINTYSPYLVVDTTLLAMIIHIHDRKGKNYSLSLFMYVITLLSITVILTLMKLYNGWSTYTDTEYMPRHTVIARNRMQSSIEADRHMQLSGITTSESGKLKTKSDKILQYMATDNNGGSGDKTEPLLMAQTELNQGDNFV